MFTQRLYRILLYCFTLLPLACAQNSSDYPTVFGRKLVEAEAFFSQNSWISDTLTKLSIDSQLAISTVFPEVLRYTALQNEFETRSLEVLYTQYGSKYADFSIGQFQIKPSFAYQIEKDWNKLINKNRFKAKIEPFDTTDTPQFRLQRIFRLKDVKWQVKYIALFFLIIEDKFNISKLSIDERVKFCSTAYNAGYWLDINELKKIEMQNHYHTRLIKPKKCYNYSRLSLYFYKKQMPK